MKVITMHEAKTHLSRYVDAALAGGEIVIARRDKPLVRLVPLREAPSRRKTGTLPGLIRRMGPDFNETMDMGDMDFLKQSEAP